MAFSTGVFDIEWKYLGLKNVFGNKKNLRYYQEALRDNEVRAWLISIGCRENL